MIRQVLRLGWHPNAKLATLATHRLVKGCPLDRNHSTEPTEGVKVVKQWRPDKSGQKLGAKIRKSNPVRPESIGAGEWPETAGDESTYVELDDARELKAHLKRQLRNVDSAENLRHVLNSIEPAMQQLESNETFGIAFQLFSDLPSTLDRMEILPLEEAARILASSPSLVSLLNRSNSAIDRLDSTCLTALLRLLVKIKQAPEDEIAQNTIRQLSGKLDALTLSQLSGNLFRTNFYADQFPTNQLVKFRGTLLEHTRARILNTNELDPANVELLEQLFYSFLLNSDRESNFEMVERLVRMLLSPDIQLDFTQAANALRSIRLASHSLYRSRGRNALYPQILADLIDKCNAVVCETLESKPTDRANHYTFLDKAHRTQNKLYRCFANLYEPRLLDRLTAFLLHEHSQSKLRRENVLQIWALVYNYSKLRIYNEQLVELFYWLVSDREFPPDEFAAAEYYLLTAYRWPFVDHQCLLDILKSSKKLLDIRKSGGTYFGIMCQLILNETYDPELLYHLNRNILWRSEMSVNKLVFLAYIQTALVRASLSTFSELNDKHLQDRIMQTLDQHLHQISRSRYRPRVRSNSLLVDRRLQEGCFLSNGVYVNAFAIYDHSIGDLLPLDQYERQFEEIDRIRLTGRQEL